MDEDSLVARLLGVSIAYKKRLVEAEAEKAKEALNEVSDKVTEVEKRKEVFAKNKHEDERMVEALRDDIKKNNLK